MQQKREMEYFKDHQTTKQEQISVINKKQRNMQQKREMEYFKDHQTTKQEQISVINKKQRNMQQKREMEYFKDHQTTKQEPISVINKKQRNMQQKREMEYFKDHQTTKQEPISVINKKQRNMQQKRETEYFGKDTGISRAGERDYSSSSVDTRGLRYSVQPENLREIETLPHISTGEKKTYMFMGAISLKTAPQYKFLRYSDAYGKIITKDSNGLLKDRDGYIAVALGSHFGQIGDRFIFELENGQQVKAIQVEYKNDIHTDSGYAQKWDKSVIEFVLSDKETVEQGKYKAGLSGNFNQFDEFKGEITNVWKVEGSPSYKIPAKVLDWATKYDENNNYE